MTRFAGETLSDARMASEGPRVTVSGASEFAGDRHSRYVPGVFKKFRIT